MTTVEERANPRGLLRRGLRVVAELVRLHPGPFAVSLTGAAVFAGGTVLATIVLGRVTDRVVLPTFETGEVPPGSLRWALAAVLAVTVVRAFGVVGRRFFAAMTAERAQTSLRHRLVDQYLGLPLSWHQRVPAGQLLAHADNDVEITADVIHPLPFSCGVIFLGFFSTIALLAVDPIIAAVAFAIFPALTLLNRQYSRRVEQPAAEVQAAVGTVSAVAHESFDGALVVKTLGRADAENERFTVAARALQEQRRRVGFIRSGFEAALDAIPNLGIVAVTVIGALRIEAGAMTIGDLVQVASLFTILALPMRVFGYFLETLPPSVVARRRLATVFAEPRPDPVPPGRTVADDVDLVARGVHFRYPDPEPFESGDDLPVNGRASDATDRRPVGGDVLTGVDLEVRAGEVVAVVGSTGSGKSTLCAVLSGLVPPTAGQVFVGGVPIEALDATTRSRTIALVFQESFLFGDTLRSNITLDAGIEPERLAAAVEIAQVDRFLPDLPAGLDTEIGERGVTLSGGQRQRVALARALVRHPSVLLLDDATSAVDPVVEQDILTGLRADVAATTVIVAQRVSTIELADRVLHLDRGRIAAVGRHRDLLASEPAYRRLVRAYEVDDR